MSQEYYIYIGLGVMIVLLIIWIIRLEIKMTRLLVGKSKNPDESIFFFGNGNGWASSNCYGWS